MVNQIFGYSRVSKGLLALILVLGIGFAASTNAYAQEKVTVSGNVSDVEGWPLMGAGVVLEGQTTVGVITDLDGNYTITVPAGSSLRFSFIGMVDAVEEIGDRSVINVVLNNATTALDEVVVTAMGISKSEKSLSYNVQETKLSNVTPTGSFVNSLNGKVAGVTINSSSTGVGGGSRVVMRGTKSISGNNNALYVVDGIPMPSLSGEQAEGIYAGAGQTGDGLSSINPDDIESISVLSGPSAAALYGSAAANGVVIITTKKGKEDTFELNYANSTSFSTAYIMPSFQNTYGQSEAGSYQSWGDKLATPSSWSPRNYFRTGLNESNSLSLSTGNAKNQTYVSLAATNSQGIISSNDYARYNASLRNTTKFLEDKLTLDVNISYSNIREQNMISQGEYMNPVVPVYLFPAGADWDQITIYERYNSSRGLMTQYWPYDNDHTMQNPYWITERQKYVNTKNRIMASASLKYKILDWLNISARAKADRSSENHSKKFNASTLDLFAGKYGYYSNSDNSTNQAYGEILVNINKYFFDNRMNLTAVLGANIEDVQYHSTLFEGNLASVANSFTYANIEKAGAKTNFSEAGYHTQKQAIFANVQLGWKSMVYLDLTARNDWPSTFAGTIYQKKGFFYPTVGLSSILTEAIPAMKSKYLNYWKVRVSYSEVGNDPSPHLTNPTYPYASGTPVTTTRMPNPDLKPERTKSFEVGTNLYLFDNNLKIDATYYMSRTYNQFLEASISASSKYTSVIANAGRVDNSGIELSVSYDQKLGPVNWNTYLTYSHNKNVVKELLHDWNVPGTEEIVSIPTLNVGGLSGVKNMLVEGGSMSAIYVTSLKTGEHGEIYVDPTTKNVLVDSQNYIYAGDTAPKHNLSWGNEFNWNGLNFGFLFTARLGGVCVSKTQTVMDFYGISKATADARDNGGALVNGYRVPAQSYYQAIAAGVGAMSMYVYDATNIRLSEVSLGYDIPINNWVKWIKGLNVSAVGHNVLMIYKKAPFDPEMTANTGTYNQGIDYFMQPSTRSFGFAIKLKF